LIAEFAGSLDDAIGAFAAGKEAAEAAGDRTLTARLASWLGEALRSAGNAAAALTPLEQVAELPVTDQASREIVIDALFQTGLAACYLGDVSTAQEAATRSEAMLQEGDPALWWAQLADLRTLISLLQGDYMCALAEVERGMACYVNFPRQDAIGYLVNVRGLVLLAQGRTREAADDFIAVREGAAAVRYPRLEGLAALNLAWAQLRGGNSQAAAASAHQAADLLVASRVREAESVQALAAACEAKDVDVTLQGLRLAVRTSQSNPDLYKPSDVLTDLAAGRRRS
jgi:ATP/maltotriose-dependent transcriptional regulator MalT